MKKPIFLHSLLTTLLLLPAFAQGQVVNVLGDSYVRNHRQPYQQTWHCKAAERCGLTYKNYGRNGSSIAWDRSAEGFGPSLLIRYREMDPEAAVVLIVAGHNDATMVGLSRDSLRCFEDSLQLFLTRVREHCPKARIGFVTPWYVPRDGFEPVVKTIRKVCRKQHVPVLDNYSRRSLVQVRDPAFRAQYFQAPDDYAHLNEAGHDLFLPVGGKFLKKLTRK